MKLSKKNVRIGYCILISTFILSANSAQANQWVDEWGGKDPSREKALHHAEFKVNDKAGKWCTNKGYRSYKLLSKVISDCEFLRHGQAWQCHAKINFYCTPPNPNH